MEHKDPMNPAGSDRRDFLKGAAVAAGAIAMTGCNLPGSERIVASPGAISKASGRTPVGDDGAGPDGGDRYRWNGWRAHRFVPALCQEG